MSMDWYISVIFHYTICSGWWKMMGNYSIKAGTLCFHSKSSGILFTMQYFSIICTLKFWFYFQDKYSVQLSLPWPAPALTCPALSCPALSCLGLRPTVPSHLLLERKNLYLRRRRVRNRFCASISLVRNRSILFWRPILYFSLTVHVTPVHVTLGICAPTVLRALNRARCRRCGRCRSFIVSHWIISFGRPIGGHITLSTHTCHTSPSLKPSAQLKPSCPMVNGQTNQIHSLKHLIQVFLTRFSVWKKVKQRLHNTQFTLRVHPNEIYKTIQSNINICR